jgi:hypothetical protein
MNTIRINIMMERIIPNQLNGTFEPVYFEDLERVRALSFHCD